MKQCVRLVCVTYVIGGIGWAAMAVLEAMSKNKAKGIINVLCAWFGYVPACIFLMTSNNNHYIGLPKACSVFVVGLEEAKKRNERYDEMMENESKNEEEDDDDDEQ